MPHTALFLVLVSNALGAGTPVPLEAPLEAGHAVVPPALQASLAASEYEFTRSARSPNASEAGASWHAANRAQNLRTTFGAAGFVAQPRSARAGDTPAWTWGLSLCAWGRGSDLHCAEPTLPVVSGNRLTYQRGALTEWYVNDEHGLEQGFTLTQPPTTLPAHERVRLDFAVTGNVSAKSANDGAALSFHAPDSSVAIRFADLRAFDAVGRVLPASFEACGNSIAILVDDRAAQYPILIDPLATNPAWTAEGNQLQANLGYFVSSAGDVNGDGHADVIVGAPFYDNGQLSEGRAFVYHGSATGLSASADWFAESDQALARFGFCVSGAGDVNGDGYDDVIVGAPNYDNGESDEGGAFLYLGSSTGLGAVASWIGESNQISAFLGVAVAAAGDVNGDGYVDLLAGARSFDDGQTDEGAVFGYQGSALGASMAATWIVKSNQSSSLFGIAVASAGDLNGDGYSDVVVGAPGYSNGQPSEGRAYVYNGSAGGSFTHPSWSAESNKAQAYFGNSVASAGDVSSDGYDDLVVGAYLYSNDQLNEGRAYVYHGSAAGLSVGASWIAEGDQIGANLGTSVAPAGDVNGDGYGDVILGAFAYDNGESNEGSAYVYDGSSVGLSAAAGWMAEGNQSGAFFGASVAGAGDVDGDGHDDVLIGAPYINNPEGDEGMAFLYAWQSAWKNLGGSMLGSLGAPVLAGSGELIGGQPMALTLANALPNTPVFLVFGLSQVGVPFLGGTLVPTPGTLITSLSTDVQGTLVLALVWPAGLPPGFRFYTQYWIPDPVGPQGFAASNGLSGTTP